MNKEDKDFFQGCGCMVGIVLLALAAIVWIVAVGFRIATS